MRNYIRGAIIGGMILLGGVGGYYFREYYPPLTISIQRYFIPDYNKDSFYAKTGSAMAGGLFGGLIGIILSESIRDKKPVERKNAT